MDCYLTGCILVADLPYNHKSWFTEANLTMLQISTAECRLSHPKNRCRPPHRSSTASWVELEATKRYLESGKGEDSLELELGASASRVHHRKSSIGGRRLSGRYVTRPARWRRKDQGKQRYLKRSKHWCPLCHKLLLGKNLCQRRTVFVCRLILPEPIVRDVLIS